MGSLRKEKRSGGDAAWILRWYATNDLGKRVEKNLVLGLASDIGTSESAARREMARLHLDKKINEEKAVGAATFCTLAASYLRHELSQLAATTAYTTKHNLQKFILPQWSKHIAVDIKPLDIEAWFKQLNKEGLAHTTIAKLKQTMQLVYKHGQRVGLISRLDDANPVKFARASGKTSYKAIIITPQQAFRIISELEDPVRTLVLLSAATGLRISESLGLQWQDIDFSGGMIFVRRTWIQGKVGKPKTEASAAPVPMHYLLADAMLRWHAETPYASDGDWVFASFKLQGKQPREGSVMAADYLRPAALRAKVIDVAYKGRFGWHNFRHSLASYLVSNGTNIKVVQEIMRHSRSEVTLDLYSQAMPTERVAAQGSMLEAILQSPFSSGTVH